MILRSGKTRWIAAPVAESLASQGFLLRCELPRSVVLVSEVVSEPLTEPFPDRR